jgi:peptidase M48-like protein
MSSFVSLCLVVCFAVAALSCSAAVAAVETTWALLRVIGRTDELNRNYLALFVLRTLPVSAPAAIVLFAMLPSFMLFEPRQTTERAEWWLIALAICSLLALTFVSVRIILLLLASWRTQRNWLRSASKLDISATIPVYALDSPGALVAVVGLFFPRMFIGKLVLEALTPEELQPAVAHECAHVRSLDNLKQIVLRATRFSRTFARMDHALCNAAEISADNCAIMAGASPLDLGSAILKVARMKTGPALLPITASHLVPQVGTSALRVRIEHLEAALENGPTQQTSRYSRWFVVGAVLAAYAVTLPLLLTLCHKLTEVLVR